MRTRALQCLCCIFIVGFAVLCGWRQNKENVGEIQTLALPDEEQAFQNVLCSCVRLQGNGYYGSGNIYRITDEQIIIVTNRHVLQYFDKNSYITFCDGKIAEGEVISVCEDYDVGFLTVEKANLAKEDLASYCSVTSTPGVYDTLQKNDCIFMVDIATDITNPKKYSGEVVDSRKYLEDYSQKMFYGDAYAKEGMSGCGIFDAYGNYLAVLSGGTQYNEIAAVPLDVIEEEYKKTKRQHALQTALFDKK